MNNKSNIWDIFEVIDKVEEYLKKHGYYNEFKQEFLILKVTQLSQYIPIANSKEYFNKVKKEFEYLINKKEYSKKDLNKLPDRQKNIFYDITNSENYLKYNEIQNQKK